MIKLQLYNESEVTLKQFEPLTTYQLSLIANEIKDKLSHYRPEFANLVSLQRNVGCRVTELFQRDRWKLLSATMLKIEPQKGNATRVLQLSDIGFASRNEFAATLADLGRLPSRQYERAFSEMVRQAQLWRLYDDGFAHPSTHFFRHVKIKELASQGYDKGYISQWIGEKNQDNLDYYLNSKFFI